MTVPHQHSVTEAKDDRLWCLHISGMDEVHAAPDRATAQLWAVQYTVMMHEHKPVPHPYDPVMNFTVQEWPWEPERHAIDLPGSVKGNTRLAQTTDLLACATSLKKANVISPETLNLFKSRIRALETFREGADV